MKGILFDSVVCIGCGMCSEACKATHNLPGEKNPPELGPDTYTVVREHGGVYYRELCRHCINPACVSACPVGALKKTEQGPVVYDEKKCIGCRYCLLACPYSIPRYQWEKTSPLVRKCNMCAHRLAKGQGTACAEVCATGATSFGGRDELLMKAHSLIRKDPGFYYARVFGESEAGGSCVLFIADRPIAEFGLKVPAVEKPLPDLTWTSLRKVPALAVGTGVFLGGVWLISRRRRQVAKAECAIDKEAQDGHGRD